MTGPGRLGVLLAAALLVGCGAAGAPRPARDGVPAAPTGLRPLRTLTGWRIEGVVPAVDVEGHPLDRPLQWGLFDAAELGLHPPLARAAAGTPLELPGGANDPARRLAVAAFHGHAVGEPRGLDLPVWTPPPPPPPPPLAFRRPDGAVELTWLPPDDASARIQVFRGETLLGVFDANVAATTDPSPGPAPVYRVVALGDTYVTGGSPPTSP